MPFTLEKRNDVNVVIATFDAEFQGEDQIKAYAKDSRELYDGLDSPVYLIIDCTDLNFSFNDVMTMIKDGVLGEHTIVNHPMNKGISLITDKRFYQMAAKGLNTASFGNLQIEIFKTVDEAIAWVREQVA